MLDSFPDSSYAQHRAGGESLPLRMHHARVDRFRQKIHVGTAHMP